ncbi:MAG: four helix bundle protein [bacterium]|nr:four helix bundle protein [bacterium]
MGSRNYKDLIVWQKSMDLVTEVYKLTSNFPSSEVYGLVSQMRRAAVSIVSNIAEGSKRNTKKDFNQFLAIAMGSGAELETQIEISTRLKFADQSYFTSVNSLLNEVMRMLNKMVMSLKTIN